MAAEERGTSQTAEGLPSNRLTPYSPPGTMRYRKRERENLFLLKKHSPTFSSFSSRSSDFSMRLAGEPPLDRLLLMLELLLLVLDCCPPF